MRLQPQQSYNRNNQRQDFLRQKLPMGTSLGVGAAMRRSKPWLLLLFLAPLARSQNPEVNTRVVECPGTDPSMMGYVDLTDIIEDQMEEYSRIEVGEAARPPYVFRLCPNSEFNTAEQYLPVLLSGSTFACGPNLASSDNCVFTSGPEQVRIEDSIVTDYDLEVVSFVGITFEGFSGSSINAFASAGTVAMFSDTIWKNFGGNFVINQRDMRVEISDGAEVRDGIGGSLFSNDGGNLIIEDMTANNLTAMSILSSSRGAITMFDKSEVFDSAVETVVFVGGGATQTVFNTTVSAMRSVIDVFLVRDLGSDLTVTSVDIRGNDLAGIVPWTAVRALENATATVKSTTMADNTGVSYGCFARMNAIMDVTSVEFENNNGVIGALTALAYVDDQSKMTLNHVKFRENFVFTASIFALFGATVDVYNTCIESGGGDTALFISLDSTFTGADNFIDPSFTSGQCPNNDAGRITKEQPNSGCFNADDDNPCITLCVKFGDAPECTATASPTSSPTTPSSTDGPTINTATTDAPSEPMVPSTDSPGPPSSIMPASTDSPGRPSNMMPAMIPTLPPRPTPATTATTSPAPAAQTYSPIAVESQSRSTSRTSKSKKTSGSKSKSSSSHGSRSKGKGGLAGYSSLRDYQQQNDHGWNRHDDADASGSSNTEAPPPVATSESYYSYLAQNYDYGSNQHGWDRHFQASAEDANIAIHDSSSEHDGQIRKHPRGLKELKQLRQELMNEKDT